MSASQETNVEYREIQKLAAKEVGGQCSIWFSFAPEGFKGPKEYPNGWEGEANRPVEFVIQNDADAVRVEVVPGTEDNLWFHGPGNNQKGTAAGIPNQTRITNADYKNAAYNSQFIERKNINLCKLVAIYSKTNPPTTEVECVEVGLGPVTINVPGDGPKVLYVGMHDGYEWNNNGGTQNVQVTVLERVKK